MHDRHYFVKIRSKEMVGMNKPRAWQRMLSGRRLDLLNPNPQDIDIADIAHGLAFVARWNGQTVGKHPFSVAEHSVLVERLYRQQHPGSNPYWNLAALLHDAAEYVIGDMISPVKNAIGNEYQSLETRLMDAIHRRFGLPKKLPAKVQADIKSADRSSAWLEATRIAKFEIADADRIFVRPDVATIAGIEIQSLPGPEAKAAFLKRFRELSSRTASENHDNSTKQATRVAIASALSSRRK